MQYQPGFHFLATLVANKTFDCQSSTPGYSIQFVMKRIAQGHYNNSTGYLSLMSRLVLQRLVLQGKTGNRYTGW